MNIGRPIKNNSIVKKALNKKSADFSRRMKIDKFDAGLIGIALFGSIAIGSQAYALIQNMTGNKKEEVKELVIKEPLAMPSKDQIGWNDNIKVLSAVSQREKGKGLLSLFGEEYSSFFTSNLMADKQSKTPEQAAEKLSKGYKSLSEVSDTLRAVQTLDSKGLFDKTDTLKNRFAIIIDGSSAKSYDMKNAIANIAFTQDCAIFKKDLKENYNLKDENIHSIALSDVDWGLFPTVKAKKQLRKTVGTITKQIENSGIDPKETELMIYYSGHGTSKKPLVHRLFGTEEYEGSHKGVIGTKKIDLNENFFKRILNNNKVLKEIKGILMINDSCHSGAWIAQAKETGESVANQITKQIL